MSAKRTLREQELAEFAEQNGYGVRTTLEAVITGVADDKSGGLRVTFGGNPPSVNALKPAIEQTFGPITSIGTMGTSTFAVVHPKKGVTIPIGKVALG